MAGPNFILDKGYKVDSAATNVTFGRFCVLQTSTSVTTAGAGVVALGVYLETVDASKIATGKLTVNVRIMGIVRVVAAGAVTLGAPVAVAANGLGTPAGAAGSRSVGIALQAAAALNDWFDVLLTPGGQVGT